MRKILIAILVLIVLGGAAYTIRRIYLYSKESVPTEVEIISVQKTQTNTPVPTVTATTISSLSATPTVTAQTLLPKEINLKVPFYAQAPFGDWSMPWQEACEEASVLLVANAYLQKNWTREQFRDEIVKLVEWERESFGKDEDTNAAQTAEMMKANFQLDSKIHTNPTLTDIQTILSKGHLIIVPLAGKHLGNPYYSNGGPTYHMLLVKGYKEGERIITNDVGTKQGENYVYSWSVFNNALHDYAKPIESGAKKIIEVLPPA